MLHKSNRNRLNKKRPWLNGIPNSRGVRPIVKTHDQTTKVTEKELFAIANKNKLNTK